MGGVMMETIEMGEVLSKDQCDDLAKLSNSTSDIMDISAKNSIVEILEKDDSRWKPIFNRDYLAYAIQYRLWQEKA